MTDTTGTSRILEFPTGGVTKPEESRSSISPSREAPHFDSLYRPVNRKLANFDYLDRKDLDYDPRNDGPSAA